MLRRGKPACQAALRRIDLMQLYNSQSGKSLFSRARPIAGDSPSLFSPAFSRTLSRCCRTLPFPYNASMPAEQTYPDTPDGRYFIVRGRLWRTSNPALAPEVRQTLVDRLMQARRRVGVAKRAGDADAERHARDEVDKVKRELGERGPVWWTDGAPDYNRRMAANTPYAQWYARLAEDASGEPEREKADNEKTEGKKSGTERKKTGNKK
jgi:hypothetical protein